VDGLTIQDVLRLARLARLELSSEEAEHFTRQLTGILEFARQVDTVDTRSVSDAPSLDDTHADTLRDDTLIPCLDRNEVLSLAPDADRERGLFKVPRVFNE
jgi:aspartyl-tRNA(Asn)/glutamyl-tRNA(Gln) amidotransferase subunit C